MTLEQMRILVIEDGDEYLENLSRFVPGPTYIQVHTGNEAVARLKDQSVDLIYLDMRFDRIDESDLLGDRDAVTRDHNGDPKKATKFLANNQGLYILAALKQEGLDTCPIILAYDFTREPKRFEHLTRIYKTLTWVPDAVTPGEIESLFLNFG
ncbi:MAG: response regulator [Myxococcota bacterium]|nr:response regulator [Myxococcota bacterium]